MATCPGGGRIVVLPIGPLPSPETTLKVLMLMGMLRISVPFIGPQLWTLVSSGIGGGGGIPTNFTGKGGGGMPMSLPPGGGGGIVPDAGRESKNISLLFQLMHLERF